MKVHIQKSFDKESHECGASIVVEGNEREQHSDLSCEINVYAPGKERLQGRLYKLVNELNRLLDEAKQEFDATEE